MTSSNGRLQPCFYRLIVLHIMALSAVAHFGPSLFVIDLSGIAMVWWSPPFDRRDGSMTPM